MTKPLILAAKYARDVAICAVGLIVVTGFIVLDSIFSAMTGQKRG